MTSDRYISFGERVGAVRRLALPHDEVTYDFRIAVWNFVEPWMRAMHSQGFVRRTVSPSSFMAAMALDKRWPQDDFAGRTDVKALDYFKNWLLNQTKWHEVYEVLERFPNWGRVDIGNYGAQVNQLLFEELSPYRLVNDRLARIVSEEEQAEVSQAVALENKYASAAEHLDKALAKFSARPNPDYENAVKESASAVETALSIANGKHQDFGDAVREFSRNQSVHPALVESASKLFGYSSDRDGVRHGKKPTSSSPPVDFAEAKLVIVSASAWVNFIAAKAP